jgi:nicotinamide phosphoribosyltransferase
MENIILRTDSYKFSHWLQYPPGTRTVFSYFESRGGVFPEVTFFGLQYFLKKYLAGEVVTAEKIDWAERRVAAHMGGHHHFNRAGWEHILNAHGGRLPVLIRAVPEGTTVPTGNVLMTIENTDPECFWLTNYLETLLVQVWYPCTVATQSRAMKKIILNNLEETGDPGLINFKLHDFGFRGVSSVETAGIGGAAHLVNFRGTDTFEAVEVACQYYQEPMAGYSIPASEHSTITSWGREHEVDAFRNMLDQYPGGLVACVSDSYDIFRACREYWGSDLKDRVLGRNGTLVVRPDSGNPPTTVVHVLNTLGQAFGYTRNSKGFTVLPPQVRVIQGDGIDFDMMGRILFNMKAAGWSADNIAFGSGGGLLQKLNRDTQRFAFKCSAIEINGGWRDVYKDPVTDPGKRSKTGRLKLIKYLDGFKTVRHEDEPDPGFLIPVFVNGDLRNEQTFSAIRQRASF